MPCACLLLIMMSCGECRYPHRTKAGDLLRHGPHGKDNEDDEDGSIIWCKIGSLSVLLSARKGGCLFVICTKSVFELKKIMSTRKDSGTLTVWH